MKYRLFVQNRLQGANLEESIFGMGEARFFRKAIDYLIASNEQIKSDNGRSIIQMSRENDNLNSKRDYTKPVLSGKT